MVKEFNLAELSKALIGKSQLFKHWFLFKQAGKIGLKALFNTLTGNEMSLKLNSL
jgi:hypothetical protein